MNGMEFRPFEATGIPPTNLLGHVLYEKLYAMLQDLGVLLQEIRDELRRRPTVPTGSAVPVPRPPAGAPGVVSPPPPTFPIAPVLYPTPPTGLVAPPETYGAIEQALGSPAVGPPRMTVATSTFPVEIARFDPGHQVTAGQGLLRPFPFVVPATGLVVVSVSLIEPAAVLTFSRNGGLNFTLLNGGTSMVPGAAYAFSELVAAGDLVDLSTNVDAVLQFLRAVYVPTV